MDGQEKFTFDASQRDLDMAKLAQSPEMPSMDDLYRDALNTREGKRALYEKALNAALENLLSWERAARSDGFEVETLSRVYNGSPRPVFNGNTVTFVQAYGVRVK